MTSTVNISVLQLFFFLFLISIPIGLFRYLNLKLTKSLLISIVRMIIQLFFIGAYLEFIFKLNSYVVNFLWIFMMIVVANLSILKESGLGVQKMFFYTLPALVITIFFILISFLLVFDISVLFNAQYVIPLGGMVLGNLLRSNIIGLDRFYSELKKQEHQYIHYLLLGASFQEALKPFLRDAFKTAVIPQIATLATIGLVSLPGMMTGQILGGSTPSVAISWLNY